MTDVLVLGTFIYKCTHTNKQQIGRYIRYLARIKFFHLNYFFCFQNKVSCWNKNPINAIQEYKGIKSTTAKYKMCNLPSNGLSSREYLLCPATIRWVKFPSNRSYSGEKKVLPYQITKSQTNNRSFW